MFNQRWSHLVRHGLIGGTLLAAAGGSQARAERCDFQADGSVSLLVGLEVSPRIKLIGGIEARRCINDQTEAMGRLEFGSGSPRLILGARVRPFQSMSSNDDADPVGFEAGGVLDLRGSLGAHLALTYGTHFLYGALQLHQKMEGAPRVSVVGGFSPWTMSQGTVVEGRPIFHNGAHVLPSVLALPRARGADDIAVRDHFVRAARYEASSVWTFLRLAAELAAVGAPRELIAAALDAADDEVRHAELCAEAAGGARLAALPSAVAQPRFTTRSPHALALLAHEAWRDGCLNEGTAAREAAFTAGEACSEVASTLATIARDEAGHAALAWAVLEWIAAIAPEVVTGLATLQPETADRDGNPPRPAHLVARGVPSEAICAAASSDATRFAARRLCDLV